MDGEIRKKFELEIRTRRHAKQAKQCQNRTTGQNHPALFGRAKSRENLLTKSFNYLTVYIQKHLSGFGSVVDKQLNAYPAMLIIRTAKWRAESDPSLREAAKHMKEGLRESEMLKLVSVRGLPIKPGLVVLLFKLHLYMPAMLLCSARVRQQKRADAGSK